MRPLVVVDDGQGDRFANFDDHAAGHERVVALAVRSLDPLLSAEDVPDEMLASRRTLRWRCCGGLRLSLARQRSRAARATTGQQQQSRR